MLPSSATHLYSPLEHRLALQTLDRWLSAPNRAEDRDSAMDFFLSVLEETLEEDEVDRGMRHENLQALLTGWLFADAPISGHPRLIPSSKPASSAEHADECTRHHVD